MEGVVCATISSTLIFNYEGYNPINPRKDFETYIVFFHFDQLYGIFEVYKSMLRLVCLDCCVLKVHLKYQILFLSFLKVHFRFVLFLIKLEMFDAQ